MRKVAILISDTALCEQVSAYIPEGWEAGGVSEAEALVVEPDTLSTESGMLFARGFEGPVFVIAWRETTGGLRKALHAKAKGFFLWPEERGDFRREVSATPPRSALDLFALHPEAALAYPVVRAELEARGREATEAEVVAALWKQVAA